MFNDFSTQIPIETEIITLHDKLDNMYIIQKNTALGYYVPNIIANIDLRYIHT
jgi:hypothetical protein